MIPKIIHYCWFGNAEKPKNVVNFILNWKKMLPDYEFMEWNESNCDLNECTYLTETYAAKKFAFVSDYIRVKKLCEYGGVYFDTDIKVIKRFDEYLEGKKFVTSFQGVGNSNAAFIAAVPNHPILTELLDDYNKRTFVLKDGSFDIISINQHLNPILKKYGLDFTQDDYQEILEDGAVYPTEYFLGFNVELWCPDITPNTCTVHYAAASWKPLSTRIKLCCMKIIYKIVGKKIYTKLRMRYKKFTK